ncbi:MAG: hypothetical protein ABEJ70_08785 [Halobacteriaceae archaeon]
MGLLELHFHDSEFTFAPRGTVGGSGTESDGGADEAPAVESEDRGAAARPGGGRGLGVIVGLLVLVAVAYAVRRFGGEEPVEVEIEN